MKINIVNLKNSQATLKIAMTLLVISIFVVFFIFVNKNYNNKTVAKITGLTEEKSKITNIHGETESISTQHIEATIINGIHKGEKVQFKNLCSYSQVEDINLKLKDEVFISVETDVNNKILSCKLIDVKRDSYILYISVLFILLMLLVGGSKGFRALASLIINIVIFSIVIKLFLNGYNLIFLSIASSLLFIVLSIFISCGVNKKALSAIIGTLVGTVVSISLAVLVLYVNHWEGVHFEEMEFLTHSPEKVFFIELLIGTLGGIMDIAITISSSIKEIYDINPYIKDKTLIKAAMDIGKDIMGTMANTLFFAYISGSIPIILLLLRNGFSISYILNINLSLEFIRALIGGIGIVLSIPIAIYFSIILLRNYQIGDF